MIPCALYLLVFEASIFCCFYCYCMSDIFIICFAYFSSLFSRLFEEPERQSDVHAAEVTHVPSSVNVVAHEPYLHEDGLLHGKNIELQATEEPLWSERISPLRGKSAYEFDSVTDEPFTPHSELHKDVEWDFGSDDEQYDSSAAYVTSISEKQPVSQKEHDIQWDFGSDDENHVSNIKDRFDIDTNLDQISENIDYCKDAPQKSSHQDEFFSSDNPETPKTTSENNSSHPSRSPSLQSIEDEMIIKDGGMPGVTSTPFHKEHIREDILDDTSSNDSSIHAASFEYCPDPADSDYAPKPISDDMYEKPLDRYYIGDIKEEEEDEEEEEENDYDNSGDSSFINRDVNNVFQVSSEPIPDNEEVINSSNASGIIHHQEFSLPDKSTERIIVVTGRGNELVFCFKTTPKKLKLLFADFFNYYILTEIGNFCSVIFFQVACKQNESFPYH